jgi:hypothetical protein
MFKPSVVIAAQENPAWIETVKSASGGSFDYLQYAERSNYIARLADDHAAMILVNGDGDEWRFWTLTPKTSPATRRIPIVLVSADDGIRREALAHGADFTATPEELSQALPRWLAVHARVPSAAQMEEMDCQCGEAMPPNGLEGIRRFNQGEYYKQHDLFEALWVEESGAVRDLYRAILQVGVAYYQITRGNLRGAHKMLLRSVQWLALLPDVCRGVDVKQLREDSYRVRAELERINDISEFDVSLLKAVKMVAAER